VRGRVPAGLLAALVVGLFVAPPASAGTAPRPHVVLIAVPDLRWSDVLHMSRLLALVRTASVGNLSVHSSGDATRCGDGLLELSAGTRVPSGVVACPPSVAEFDRLGRAYRSASFAPRVGTLPGPLPSGPGVSSFLDTELYGARAADRQQRRDELDAAIDGQVRDTGAGAVVIVAGISDNATGPAHLHAVLVSGPGFAGGELRSASTGRTGYVQLVDLTATVLALTSPRGGDLPDRVIGRPLRSVPGSHRSPAALADDGRHARAAADVSGGTRNVLAIVATGVVVLFWARLRRAARWCARLFAAAPLLTFVVQVVPWWRWGTVAYAGLVAAGSVAVGAAVAVVERRDRTAALLAVPALTALVFVADQLAGAPLDLSAPMGDNPIVAGRFHGMGNMAFALMAASALFCAGVLAARAPSTRKKLAAVAGIGAVVLAVDAAPPLGDDLGGLLALLPAVVVLGALVAGVRVTWRRALLVAGVTLVVAAVVGALDAARPPDRRTHIGRFVAHLAHGHLDPVAGRKLRAMLRSFSNVALDVFVAVTAAAAVTLRRLVPAELHPALAAVAVVGVLGTLLNDSGVAVAAGAALAVVPAVVGDTRVSGAE
jgi:hypothetical protein